MKKSVLSYFIATVVAISLQSCVSNYVVSAPTNSINEYKSNAKLTSLDQKNLEVAKTQLLSSFKEENLAVAKNLANSAKNAELSRTIRFTKKIDDILTEAKTYLGTPYRYGGMTRNGIDCSAFVLSVFGAVAGVNLPRIAASQAQEGEKVAKEDLQKGDLIFFSQGKGRISHVAIVENVTEDGEVQFIHAATSKGVSISSLNSSYWGPKFRFAKRIISQNVFDSNYANN